MPELPCINCGDPAYSYRWVIEFREGRRCHIITRCGNLPFCKVCEPLVDELREPPKRWFVKTCLPEDRLR